MLLSKSAQFAQMLYICPATTHHAEMVSNEKQQHTFNNSHTMAQFHVDDLFLGDLNCDDDPAKLRIKPRFKTICR